MIFLHVNGLDVVILSGYWFSFLSDGMFVVAHAYMIRNCWVKESDVLITVTLSHGFILMSTERCADASQPEKCPSFQSQA